MSYSDPPRSSRRRVSYCAAITKAVLASTDSALKLGLTDLLTETSYEQMTLADLEELAGQVGVEPDRIAELNEIDNTPFVEEATYLCARCLDVNWIEIDGHPGRYDRCPNCNPEDDDEPSIPDHAHA